MSVWKFCSACAEPLQDSLPVTCNRCGATFWRNAKPCAGALVAHQGKLLMVRRAHEPWNGYWDIPGGFCEEAEHPIFTAEREVKEETGLEVRITGYLGMWIDDYDEPPDTKTTLNIYYHAVPVHGLDMNVDRLEVTEIGWFPPDSLPASLAFPGHVLSVLRAWRDALSQGNTVTPLLDRPTL